MKGEAAVLDQAFRALSDPTRRAILERLAERPLSVRELAEPLPMTLSAVVQHVQVLEAGGLVTTTKIGRTRNCELRGPGLRAAEAWLGDRRAIWEGRLDALGAVLDARSRRRAPSRRRGQAR